MTTIKELKKKEKRGVVVTLFDRYGGNTIGYKMAGLKVYMNINRNNECNKVYKYNNRDVFVYEDKLENIKNKHIKKIIRKKHIDILDICLPDMKYSINKDFLELNPIIINVFCLIKELNPKVIVMHVNKGILQKNKKIYLNTILDGMRELKYLVDYEKLNVKYYEVPQSAEFVCIMGIHKDIGIKPIFPEQKESIFSVKNSISDFLEIKEDTIMNENCLDLLKKLPPGNSISDAKNILGSDDILFNLELFRRERWEEPYYALSRYVREKPIHPIKPRYMHFNEILRLQTFPDDYVLLGDEKIDLKNLCLSIPPNYIKNISSSITKYILDI